MGYTPWGTYLACEENFNGYFRVAVAPADRDPAPALRRRHESRQPWWQTDERFNTDLHPNEPNRFGWVTEINPWEPRSTPVKRTALGRVKHEGAWVQEARDGRIVVYMGDDQVFEYIYRYVSNQPWRTSLRQGISPLDDGVLYVARFDANGTGTWLPLTPDNPALAGWSIAGHPDQHAVRRRPRRGDEDGPAGVDRHVSRRVDGRRHADEQHQPRRRHQPRASTPPTHGRTTCTGTSSGGGTTSTSRAPTSGGTSSRSAATATTRRTGRRSTATSSGHPMGSTSRPSGRMWIQTDVSASTINSGAYAGFGNNQMLCADPTDAADTPVPRRTQQV